jgi:hypothetical protein
MTASVLSQISNHTLIGQAIHELANAQSTPQQASMLVDGVAISGETYTINGVIYELLAFVDSGVNVASGALNNLTNPIDILFGTHARTVGEFLLIEAEFMEVTKVIDADNVRLSRGALGSAIATHAATPDILENISVPTAGEEPIGLTDEAVAATIITDIVNGHNSVNGREATAIDAGDGIIVWTASSRGGTGRPTVTDMVNGTFLNGAVMNPGVEPGTALIGSESRSPTAAEVTAGFMKFAFNKPVQNAILQAQDGAGALLALDSDAITAYVGNIVTVTIGGGLVPITASDIASVTAFG